MHITWQFSPDAVEYVQADVRVRNSALLEAGALFWLVKRHCFY